MTQMLPTRILHNVYDNDTLKTLQQEIDYCGQKHEYCQTWEGPNFGKILSTRWRIDINKNLDIKEKILTPLFSSDLYDNIMCDRCEHLKSMYPYEIHSDWGHVECHSDEQPFYTIIIPLETIDTRTILLDQTFCGLHFIHYKEKNLPLPEGQYVSDSVYQEHFSHCWPQEQKYISIQNIFKWQAGSVIMFDMRYLHLSDNYHKNSVTEKNALVLFSKIKTNQFSKYL